LYKKPSKIKNIGDLKSTKEEVKRKKVLTSRKNKYRITVHLGTCGIASGAEIIQNSVKEEISSGKISNVEFTTSGCVGFCALEPMLTVESYNLPTVTYHSLDRDKVKRIFKSHIYNSIILKELDPITEDSKLANFYKHQKSRVLRNRGKIDPFKIEDYIAEDGYLGLARAVESSSPEKIIKIIKESGLRGRGGGGFPTGIKWELCRNACSQDGTKYVICNGDEGDPGAFMDRNLLESDPHSVLEGILIAALAIGSNKGYLYIRAEYPLAVRTLKHAIKQAKDWGLIGKNILGSDFSFDVEIYQGAGAFVCGEETALIASIEGKRGMPMPRPPFPAVSGLHKKPTNINNVETLSNVPEILNFKLHFKLSPDSFYPHCRMG
jgi:(2Fe-2S) ferredoxin